MRHGKLLYRALGIHNVAIPGDSHHGRFFVSIIADFSGKWYSISADLPCVLRFMRMIFEILAVTFETVKFCFNFFLNLSSLASFVLIVTFLRPLCSIFSAKKIPRVDF